MKSTSFKSIDYYINKAPVEVRKRLEIIRKTIQKAAPEAQEKISYAIPTFTFHGNLVHFAAFSDHLSFFPTSSGVSTFQKELTGYKTSKGTIQFPLDKPLPIGLITKDRKSTRLNSSHSAKSRMPSSA